MTGQRQTLHNCTKQGSGTGRGLEHADVRFTGAHLRSHKVSDLYRREIEFVGFALDSGFASLPV
jgi:hypothetical protein